MNRRDFLTTAAAFAIHSSGAATPPIKPLSEFSYSHVTLTGGPLRRQYDHLHSHFLSLDNDRLLKVYRQRAGLPAPGEDMGGWYDADGFVPGHTLGQYISRLARYYATTYSCRRLFTRRCPSPVPASQEAACKLLPGRV